jgi:hypothetical protein
MIKFDNSGFNELERKLKKMEQSAQAIEGTNSVPFTELFPDGFMKKFTTFTSIENMLNESPFTIQTDEDFAAIDDSEWDEYIRKVTKFHSWEQMQEEAALEWTAKKLGF